MLHVKDDPILLENIITGIEKICKARRIDCCRRAVSLLVRNNLMRPDHVFTYSQESRRRELIEFCEECIGQLSNPDPFYQRLLKLQACFHRLSGKEDRMLSEYDQLLVRTLEPMKRAIIVFEPRGTQDVEKAFDMIAKYSMLLTLVGDAADPESFKAVRAILRSFYGKSDLSKFRLKPLHDRARSLNDLAYTTAGMLLYKSVCSGISGNFTQYADKMEAALLEIETTLSNVSEYCMRSNQKLVNIISSCINLAIEDGEIKISVSFPDSWEYDQYVHVYYMSLIQHQAITYIGMISKAICNLKKQFKLWSISYLETMKSIIKIANRVDVIKFAEAYQMFMNLSLTNKNFFWGTAVIENFQGNLKSLKKYFKFDNLPLLIKEIREHTRDQINENSYSTCQLKYEPCFPRVQDQYSKIILKYLISTGHENIDRAKEYTVDERISKFIRKDLSSESSGEMGEKDLKITRKDRDSKESVGEEWGTDYINALDPSLSKLESCDLKLLMFNGFDPVALVEGDGILLQANPTIGFFPFLDCFIGFYFRETAERFSKEANRYFIKIVDFVRINPIYIEILQVYDLIKPLIGYGWLYTSKEAVRRDEGTQTSDDFLGTYGEQYTLHSRWAMNAAVIKMADIQNKRTKSCMVELVQYRTYDQACQTVELEETGTQTRREEGTCTAKPAVWRHGLRGERASTVSLTIPPEEPHLRSISPRTRGETSEIYSQMGDYLEFIGTKNTLLYSVISLCSTFLDNFECQTNIPFPDETPE